MEQVCFEAVVGCDWESWLEAGVFRTPGGQHLIQEWRQSTDGLTVQAGADDNRSERPDRQRWEKAQKAEAAFWKSWRKNDLYAHVPLTEFWEDVVAKTGGPLAPGKTLDVGCGPVSVLNFVRPEGVQPMGVDPLAAFYAREKLVESGDGLAPMPMIALPAEKLPFAENSFDHLICYNVLDHVADAPAVLKEIRRVVKPGGSVRVYVHTFQSWIKRFLFFDTPHVYHWDHAEFAAILTNHGFAIEKELAEPKTFDLPSGVLAKLKNLPYLVASRVTYTSYFLLRKPA